MEFTATKSSHSFERFAQNHQKNLDPLEDQYNRLHTAAPQLPRMSNGCFDVTPYGVYIAIAERNDKQSPLLRLPAEIRNQIFELAIGGRTMQTLYGYCYGFSPESGPWGSNDSALLQVCRRIYAETALLPFALNVWHVEDVLFTLGWYGRKLTQKADPPYFLRSYQWKAIPTLVTNEDYSRMYVGGCRDFYVLAKMPALKKIIITESGRRAFTSLEFPMRGRNLLLSDKEVELVTEREERGY